ncbi:MAG: hypothetical protein KKF67_00295 [Nanoarchaeota archaeon]|nr:hypothetical protein [Nanoarchaeota archaeon]
MVRKKRENRFSATAAATSAGRKRQKSKFGKYLTLTWMKFFILIIVWVVCILLHNLFYAIFRYEEPVFFIIAVILIPLYFFVSFVYTLVQKVRFRFS